MGVFTLCLENDRVSVTGRSLMDQFKRLLS